VARSSLLSGPGLSVEDVADRSRSGGGRRGTKGTAQQHDLAGMIEVVLRHTDELLVRGVLAVAQRLIERLRIEMLDGGAKLLIERPKDDERR